MIRILAALVSILFCLNSRAGETPQTEDGKNPVSEGAATTPPEEPKAGTELILRLGNESNKPDGIFGPYTYGVRGAHFFESGLGIEAGFIRLHEPGTPAIFSALDEAQFTLKLPEYRLWGQPLTLSGTAWKNRMIDMYTNVGGLELTRAGAVSVTGGLYFGTASRDELSQRYFGTQLAFTYSLDPLEFSAGQVFGRIEDGYYRKSALQVATNLLVQSKLPVTWTLSLEDRFFSFGGGGPVSSPDDELILITGFEIHFEKAVLGGK